jgi:hypothetical protein
VIRARAGIEAEPVEGERSQFDVVSDGTLLFSKQAEGRFPEEQEILQLLS